MGGTVRRIKRLQADQAVSQYGNAKALLQGRVFKNRPDAEDVDGVSVILGKLQPHEAALCVGRMPRGDRVRWSTVGALQVAGFEVAHDPTNWNPLHALVKQQVTMGRYRRNGVRGLLHRTSRGRHRRWLTSSPSI